MNEETIEPVDMEAIFTNNRSKAAEAIDAMGGPALAGRIITEKLRSQGISKKIDVGKVWAWLNRDKRGIPLEYLLIIEKESGVSRKDLRGDVPWPDC